MEQLQRPWVPSADVERLWGIGIRMEEGPHASREGVRREGEVGMRSTWEEVTRGSTPRREGQDVVGASPEMDLEKNKSSPTPKMSSGLRESWEDFAWARIERLVPLGNCLEPTPGIQLPPSEQPQGLDEKMGSSVNNKASCWLWGTQDSQPVPGPWMGTGPLVHSARVLCPGPLTPSAFRLLHCSYVCLKSSSHTAFGDTPTGRSQACFIPRSQERGFLC